MFFLHLFRFHQIIRSHHLNPTQNYILQCPVKVELIFTLSNRICFICVLQLLPERGQKEGQNQCESILREPVKNYSADFVRPLPP